MLRWSHQRASHATGAPPIRAPPLCLQLCCIVYLLSALLPRLIASLSAGAGAACLLRATLVSVCVGGGGIIIFLSAQELMLAIFSPVHRPKQTRRQQVRQFSSQTKTSFCCRCCSNLNQRRARAPLRMWASCELATR